MTSKKTDRETRGPGFAANVDSAGYRAYLATFAGAGYHLDPETGQYTGNGSFHGPECPARLASLETEIVLAEFNALDFADTDWRGEKIRPVRAFRGDR